MKIFSYVMIALAASLAAFNAVNIDINSPLEGKSKVAVICVLAAICAIVLLFIFLKSRKIIDKLNQ